MSFAETALLGALAGFTIFLGLPFARLQLLSSAGRVALAMFAVGVLAFLFVDVLEHGFALVEKPVEAFRDGKQGAAEGLGRFALLFGGFALGTAGLAMAERRLRPSARSAPPIAGGAVGVTAEDRGRMDLEASAARTRALQTGMTVAAAIGLHNFAEGLAIGVSAGTGEIGLATVLIIGFALHNATEGFGIVGPLGGVRPSWKWIGLAGLIGGAPTFIGTMVGYSVNSEALELTFYAVAGGAILTVIGEVWNGMRRHGHRELGMAMLAVGFGAGFLTDLLVVYGGG